MLVMNKVGEKNMKHYFGVIVNEKIIDILNKVYNNQKINIYEKIRLNILMSDYNPKKYNSIDLSDEVFRVLNYTKFISLFGKPVKKQEGFNYYGVTIIPYSSLKIIYESFLNLSKEEMDRFRKINMAINEYNDLIQPIVNLLKKAYEDKQYIIHFGI